MGEDCDVADGASDCIPRLTATGIGEAPADETASTGAEECVNTGTTGRDNGGAATAVGANAFMTNGFDAISRSGLAQPFAGGVAFAVSGPDSPCSEYTVGKLSDKGVRSDSGEADGAK